MKAIAAILALALVVGGFFFYQREQRLERERSELIAEMQHRDEAARKEREEERRASAAKIDAAVKQAEEKVEAAKPVWAARTTELISAPFTVPAGKQVTFPFKVTQDMSEAYVSGSFTAAGGARNGDIEVYLTTPGEFQNVSRGLGGKALYNSGGRKQNGTISTGPLPQGEYVLAFDAKTAWLVERKITASATLHYKALSSP